MSNRANPPPSNLSAPLSSFIGRQRELAEAARLLAAQRLLTLTGPGGCGKTRLALELARRESGAYPDGAWLVELAALSDPALVPQAAAASLGLSEGSGRPALTTLQEHLRDRRALLLLDNCEHLLEASAQLCAGLLGACPQLRLLATSREPLGVPGESLYTVPPLGLPEPQPWRSPAGEPEALAAYRQSEALQLFEARAAAAQPHFELTAENAPWAAEVCRRLDGLPLAIELAAARVRLFPVRQIAERLDERFKLLTGGPQAGPSRHQTLEAALDWSHALLDEGEQQLFRRLAVFAGGWSLEAAAQVCTGSNGPDDTLPRLAGLVDKSLVVVERQPGRARFRLLETIRAYARRKLEAAGEAPACRDRHLEYYTRWAETAEPKLAGAQQAVWAGRFDREHDNLRRALEWSLAGPERAHLGLRLAAACSEYWRVRSYLSEGRQRLERALQHSAGQPPDPVRAWALIRLANLAYLQSDFPAVAEPANAALELSEQLGPAARLQQAYALDVLGELATEVGEYAAAPPLFERALRIFEEQGDTRGAADMHMQLGWAAMRAGDYDSASAYMLQALPLFRQLDETRLLGFVLAGLGELAVRQGRYPQAADWLQESLALRRALGYPWGTAATLGSIGWLALEQGDFEGMHQALAESLEIRVEIGDLGGCAWCLEKLAEAAVRAVEALPLSLRGHGSRRAAVLSGAAQALRQPLDSVIDPADQPAHEALLAQVREALGEREFTAAWEQGQSLPLEAAVHLALQPVVGEAELAALTDTQRRKAEFGGLSPRERQAAALIARGLSNREIAEQMTVRVKTVETYVTRILNKLGVDSRVQIATWALQAGLPELEEFK